MITQEEAIEMARKHIANRSYVDANDLKRCSLFTREQAMEKHKGLSIPEMENSWLVTFGRIKMGDSMDEISDKLTVSIETKSGKVEVLDEQ